MLKLGLTGSIAVGKSFVCSVFRENGCHILDADQTARDVVSMGSEGLGEIVAHFGRDILTADGELDRRKMADIVFADDNKRSLLNSIIHPLVFVAQDRWIRECEQQDPNGIAIVDAALMIESGGYKRFDKIIVVWCKPDIQLQRLTQRDHLNIEDATKRIASQMSQDEKKRFADILIDTSVSTQETHDRVLKVLDELRTD